MTDIVNPKISIEVIGLDSNFVIEHLIDTDPDISFSIEKDLDEEPNEATLIIGNLSMSTQHKLTDSANQSAPVLISVTPSGVDEFVLAFRGELESAISRKLRWGGHETTVVCTSQQENLRAKYVDQKTFAKGTGIDEIMNFFIDTIDLPKQIDDLPTTGILLSQTFSGPAFKLLQRFAFDTGYYAYILDGYLHVSSIYVPQDDSEIEIAADYLLEPPESSVRTDREDIAMKTVVETTNTDPFAKKKKKKKRRVKLPLGNGKNVLVSESAINQANGEAQSFSDDYAEYEAVEKTIEGVDLELRMQPHINPDNIVTVPSVDDKKYRVKSVKHFGDTDTFDDWTTELMTDIYDPLGFGADSETVTPENLLP